MYITHKYRTVDYIQNKGLKVCLRGLGRCCSGESAFPACSRTAVQIFRMYVDAMWVQRPICNLRKQKVQVGNPWSRLVSQTTRMASFMFRDICLNALGGTW